MQVELGAAALPKEILRPPHQGGAHAATPSLGCDRDEVNPASVAIESGHAGTDQRALVDRDQEEIGLHRELAADVEDGVIAGRPVRKDGTPQRDHGVMVAALIGAYLHELGLAA